MARLHGRLPWFAWLAAGGVAILLLLLLASTGAVLADSGGWPTLTPTATPTASLTPTWTPIPIPTITIAPVQPGEIPPGPGGAFFTPQASPKVVPTGTLLSGDQLLATLQAENQPQPPVTNRNSAALIVFILVAAGLLVLGLAVYLWWYWSNRPTQPPEEHNLP